MKKIYDLVAIFAVRESIAPGEFDWVTEDPLVRQALEDVRWAAPPTVNAAGYSFPGE